LKKTFSLQDAFELRRILSLISKLPSSKKREDWSSHRGKRTEYGTMPWSIKVDSKSTTESVMATAAVATFLYSTKPNTIASKSNVNIIADKCFKGNKYHP
jgi:hypothetical protein